MTLGKYRIHSGIIGSGKMSDNVINRISIKKHEIILRIIVYTVSIILLFMTVYPFIQMIGEFIGLEVDNPSKVLKIVPKRWKEFLSFIHSRVATGFVNSVIVTASSTVLNVYFSAMTAFSISVYKWKFRKAFGNMILILMMIPTTVAAAGFIPLAYKFHMNNTLSILILPAIATPISVVFMRLYLDSAFEKELVYSARIDGAGELRIFHQIALPILKPAIATQAVFAVASSWNDTFKPMVLLTEDSKRTLPVMLSLNRAMGESVMPDFISIVPLVIVYIILSRHLVEDVRLGSVKL